MLTVGQVFEHGFRLKPCGKYRAFVYFGNKLLGLYEIGSISKVLEGMIALMEALQERERMEWEGGYREELQKGLSCW